MTANDRVQTLSADGRIAIVSQGSDIPLSLERVDLVTGLRTPLRQLAPANSAGLVYMNVGAVSEDGRQCAYSYARCISTLFLLSGATTK